MQVACDMRNSRNESGDNHFTREEWLTKTQVKGLFLRIAKLRKNGGACKSRIDEELFVEDVVEDLEDDDEEKET